MGVSNGASLRANDLNPMSQAPPMRNHLHPRDLFFAALLLPLASAVPAAPGGEGVPMTAESTAKVTSLFESVVSDLKADATYECQCSQGKCAPEECPSMNSPEMKFTKMLSFAGQDVVKLIEPMAVGFVKSKDVDGEDAEALIGMFLTSRSANVLGTAEAMHAAAPAYFSSELLLGFCELGSKSLTGPLAKRVKSGKADVGSAAFFALRGDKVGAKVLKAALKQDVSTDTAADVLMAGLALERLGKKGALAHSQEKIHAAALVALDAGDLDQARFIAVAASMMQGSNRMSEPALSSMKKHCMEYCEKAKEGDLASADKIFEKLEAALAVI